MTSAAELFARTLEQPPHRRQRFVERCTRDHQDLRQEVLSLLRSHEAAAGFLDPHRPAPREATRGFDEDD